MKIEEGCFAHKNARFSEVDKILTLAQVNNVEVDYDNKDMEICYIFENKYGQRFSSIMHEHAQKTDCSVIEYNDQGGHISFGKI